MRTIIGGAHPLEKSAPGFENTSIHRLSRRWVTFEDSYTLRSQFDPRNVCRNAWKTVVL